MAPAPTKQGKGAIATFIIDWPVLAFIGALFGYFAPERGWARSRALTAGAIAAAVFTGTAMLSYVFAPDWMWMYYVDPDAVSWAVPLIAVGYALTFIVTFLAAITLKGPGRRGRALGLAAVMLIFEAVLVGFTWDRYSLVGDRAEWLGGGGDPLFSAAPAGDARTIGLLGPVFLVTLGACLWFAWKGRRAHPPRR